MREQRIYIDTSVAGGCLDHEFDMESKGLFEPIDIRSPLEVVSP